MEERLQKLMARANVGSRRASESIIAAGRVTVNGRVAKVGDKADPSVAVSYTHLTLPTSDLV